MRIRHWCLPIVVVLAVPAPTLAAACTRPANLDRPTVSKELAPTLKNAQDAMNRKDYALTLAELKKTEGKPQSEFDEYVICMLRTFAEARVNGPPPARTD